MLHGASLFQIQPFSGRNPIDRSFLEIKPFPPEEISRMAERVSPYFGEVRMEGV